MRRWLLALAVVPVLLIGVRADYLVIKVDVNKAFVGAANPKQGSVLSLTPAKMKGPGGFPKAGFPGGGFPAGGPKGGMPGGGMPGGGMTGGGFPGGGYGGKSPGGFFPRGGGGFPGGGAPGSGIPGGGIPGGGVPGGGAPKAPNPMDDGGFSVPQKPAQNPMAPTQGNPKNPKAQPGIADSTPRWALAYLELRGRTLPVFTMDKITHIAIEHPWGKHCVVPLENILYIAKDATPLDYTKRLKALAKEGKTPAKLLRLAEWALAHGLMKEFHTAMADVNNSLEKATEPSPSVKMALAAYQKVKDGLKKALAGDDPLQAEMINDLKSQSYQATASSHYLLLTDVTGELVKRRLALLEETYEKFYYWFALRSPESVPPMPGHRLLGVLVGTAKDFNTKHALWGSLPLVADGFLPRRDNVVIMCAEHLDETYGLLKKNNEGFCKSLRLGRDDLLSGSVWNLPDAKQNDLNVAMLQTLTLVERATEAQAERNTISHEASRQLLFATGLLPRNVAVPEWIQYGLASFFETPPGAFYPGLGITSWSNLVDFKFHKRKNHFAAPKDVLAQLVGDVYFKRASEAAALAGAGQEKAVILERAQREQEIARSTAWALVYYLARENKLGALVRYSQELDRLPRDVDLNDRILRNCFFRAFDLNDGALAGFANAWFAEMENYVLEMPTEYERAVLQGRLEGTPPTTGK